MHKYAIFYMLHSTHHISPKLVKRHNTKHGLPVQSRWVHIIVSDATHELNKEKVFDTYSTVYMYSNGMLIPRFECSST